MVGQFFRQFDMHDEENSLQINSTSTAKIEELEKVLLDFETFLNN